LNNPPTSRIPERIAELRREQEAGQAELRALDQRARELKHTLLRIASAIEVLKEIEADARGADD
jgi:hypothetical protein